MDAIIEIFKIDFAMLLTSVCVILVAVKSITCLLEWVIKKLGLETKWMRNKRAEHELLLNTARSLSTLQEKHDEDLKKFVDNQLRYREQSLGIQEEWKRSQKQIFDSLETLSQKIDTIRKENIDKDAEDMRWTILKFSTDLSNGKVVTREAYNYIFKIHDKYDRTLKENNMENGLVDESIAYIRERFHEDLKHGVLT